MTFVKTSSDRRTATKTGGNWLIKFNFGLLEVSENNDEAATAELANSGVHTAKMKLQHYYHKAINNAFVFHSRGSLERYICMYISYVQADLICMQIDRCVESVKNNIHTYWNKLHFAPATERAIKNLLRINDVFMAWVCRVTKIERKSCK